MRFYVKSLYSGWHEVTEEQYNNFCELLRNHITNMTGEQKEKRIKERTKIEN